MMGNTLWPQSLLMGWHIHLLSGIVLAIGIVLFIVWAAKTLDKKSLATWALIFVIIGILGTFLTITWSGKFWSNMMGGLNGDNNWQKGILEMMQNDETYNSTTPDKWRDDMIKEMQEHMGINK